MTTGSATDLLVLHAVRLAGMADDHQVAARYGLDRPIASELLLDLQAYGWVSRVDFAGTGGWTLTATGRRRNEQQLAAELTASGCRADVSAVHRDFLPSNARLLRASTDWQLRPSASDPLAPNQHDDADWDARLIDDLTRIGEELADLEPRLTSGLSRFAGYHARFVGALARVQNGDPSWVTRVREDSCHTVWMELHEDLLATLGLQRGMD
ncbi:MAG TPA: transcriptional regulator [Microlunatus sp.]